jgi:DNA-binding beta-propeller fold protein YncE
VANNGRVFVTDTGNHRVQYFTGTGSFLGKWGSLGTGNGRFNHPEGVAVRPTGSRVYVADNDNERIQYFNRGASAVSPSSLGRVKALFE